MDEFFGSLTLLSYCKCLTDFHVLVSVQSIGFDKTKYLLFLVLYLFLLSLLLGQLILFCEF